MDVDRVVVGIPSRGRLRDDVVALLSEAGCHLGSLRGRAALAELEDGISLIEMRPRDAAVALAANRIDAAFIATDLITENELEDLSRVPLGFSRSDLIVACRDDAPYARLADLAGCVVATHLPRATEQFFAAHNVAVMILEMAGSLEGVCAAGLSDAIVDLRETGISLAQNSLRILAPIQACEAQFVFHRGAGAALERLKSRLEAVLAARLSRYVLLHLPKDRIATLQRICAGLESPTVLPLAGNSDVVAVHFVAESLGLWDKLDQLKELGATSIVTITPDAII